MRFDKDTWADLPEPNDEWGQREMTYWAFRAVRLLRKELAALKAQIAHGVAGGVDGPAAARPTPSDTLVAQFGAVEAEALRARFGLGDMPHSSSVSTLKRIHSELGRIPSDEEMQRLLPKLSPATYYSNATLQGVWNCTAPEMAAYRYLLNKKGCLEFVKNYGWKKVKNNIAPI